MAAKCPKCGDTGYQGLREFECDNIRCDNCLLRRRLSRKARRDIDLLWELYDQVSDKEVIWDKIWELHK